MKRTPRRSRQDTRNNRLDFSVLESRIMLANDLLPDIFAWEDASRGYLHDYVVEGDLLRFTTAFANQGAGHLEVYGGEALDNGNQEVIQRIYDDEGGFRDRVAGEFTYHPSHGHIHFDGYAIYNLRDIGPNGEVGDIVATGGKISFCLIDITRFDPDAGSSNYGGCGTTQGVSAGWSDVYSRGLSDQWINISGINDGDYYLEVVTDPEGQLEESDETNNTTIITVTIDGGPGAQGDRFESNNSFGTAYNLGMFSDRVEAGLSIHTDQDVDYYQFNAVEAGDFEVHVNFSHALGNIDAFIYDDEFNLVTSGDSTTDLEDLHFDALPDQAYYLKVIGVGGITNAYDLEFYGPGELITGTVMSGDVPVSIPDNPGPAVTSTLEGPDITLTDLNLIFEDLNHTYLGDLHFELTSPAGTTAILIRSTFESPSGPLGGEDDFTNTFLDDQAPTNIDNGNAPYSGSFNVNYGDISNPFSAFNGESALGTWTVSIRDLASADTGTLNAWGLMFTGVDNNPGDALEQNDAFPQATDLGTIGTVGHTDLSIHNQSDVDFFRFNAQDSTHVQIDLGFLHSNGNLDFIVYDSNQQEIARADSINDNESLSVPVIQGELYFIEVFGFNAAINDYTFNIDVPLMVAESGSIGVINQSWQTVNLSHEFDNPVVFASVPGYNSLQPVTVEIDNVTSNSFDVQLHSWQLQVGRRLDESVNFVVFEAGTHTLRDGTKLVAGHHDTSDSTWSDVNFAESFDAPPIVFTQLENRLRSAFTARLMDIDQDGFSILAQTREIAKPQNLTLSTHWLAIEPGTGTSANGIFEIGSTGTTITDVPSNVSFASEFTSTPGFLMSAQTSNEMDTANVRISNANNQFASVFMEEETSLDLERNHAAEDVGYFAFMLNNSFYAMEPQSFGKGFASDTGSLSPNIDATTTLRPVRVPVLDAAFAKSIDFNGRYALEPAESLNEPVESSKLRTWNEKNSNEPSLVSVASQSHEPETTNWDEVAMVNRTERSASLVDQVFEDIKQILHQR